MSLREITLQTPDAPAPDADECPACAYFVAAAERYPADDYPTIRRHLDKARRQHVADGECLAVPDGE
ncbi:hypothetical protein [Kitasatospora aureofaciens]|uniref:hypothetical protein n=1 Tax=Kitasatospora aureofaciens TaxID=1894 RepID=UPI001C43B917|nr:hypothetical protein [Kitasatospora aureofaciens]MBV6698022.1 hypothetical protein [Kitasatospora aureofaciens]